MDTLPGLLAPTCTDDTRTDLVVCHPVTGTCASTTIEDPTAKLCGDVRRARVAQHHLPLNLLYLMTPDRSLVDLSHGFCGPANASADFDSAAAPDAANLDEPRPRYALELCPIRR